MEAFVLIQTDDTTKTVAGALRDIGDVVAADDLRGPYDAIARVEVNGVSGRLEEHLANIKAIPGVDRAIVAPLINDPQGVAGDEAA